MNIAAKKLIGMVLAGVLGAASLTGCGDQSIDGTKVLITSGEDKVTMGTANMMLRMNQVQVLSYYSMFGGSTTGIWDQEMEEGKTYGDTTKENVLNQIQDMILLKQHAEEYEVSISEEEQQKIEEAAKAFMDANTEEVLTKLAVSQSDIEQLLTLYTYQEKMYDPMTADVDTHVEDSEAAQSRITYSSISLSGTQNEDGTTTELTDEEKEAKKEQAQEILDKLQASEDPAAADLDALAKEVDENLSATSTTFDDEDTVLDENLMEAAQSLTEDGQVYEEVVEGENSYFVVRMDSILDREATDQEKETIVNERKQEAYNDLLETWGEETEMDIADKEWNKITLTDTDMYTMKTPEVEDSTTETEGEITAEPEEDSETDTPAEDETDTGADEAGETE